MPLDPDIPWGLNFLLFAVVALTPVIALWLTNRKTRAKLHEMGEDIAASRHQVENEHADSEYPNLREEITEIRKVVAGGFENFRTDIGGMRSEMRDMRQDITGLRTDARHDRREFAQLRAELASKTT